MKVQHRLFGDGLVFGQRELGVGPVWDVWFIPDEKVRTVLAEPKYWTEPHGRPVQFLKRKMMTAYRQWKKLHMPAKSETAFIETPKPCPENGQQALEDEIEELIATAAD